MRTRCMGCAGCGCVRPWDVPGSHRQDHVDGPLSNEAKSRALCIGHGENVMISFECNLLRSHLQPGSHEVISGMRTTAQFYVYLDVAAALAAGLPLYRSANGVILSPGERNLVCISLLLRRTRCL
jgi:hypothetical protein